MITANTSNSPGLPTAPALFDREATQTVIAGQGGHILACLNDSLASASILAHALVVGRGLDLPLTVARVLEAPRHLSAPADPLEWQARRRESLDRLERLVAGSDFSSAVVGRVLLAGPAADELIGWASDNDAGLIALGTHEGERGARGLGGTTQRVMDRSAASLLLVPAGCHEKPILNRLLVPLDGSCRAESVLPLAVRLARANGSELVLAHVVPHSEAVDREADGPAHALCMRLDEQNEQGARAYLDQLEARLWKERVPVRAVVVTEGDARTELCRLAGQLRADLIIMSSHGWSAMRDVPCGSVAEYLVTHAPAPLLMVRPNFAQNFHPVARPTQAGSASADFEHA